jgi:hypothetical protein
METTKYYSTIWDVVAVRFNKFYWQFYVRYCCCFSSVGIVRKLCKKSFFSEIANTWAATAAAAVVKIIAN